MCYRAFYSLANPINGVILGLILQQQLPYNKFTNAGNYPSQNKHIPPYNQTHQSTPAAAHSNVIVNTPSHNVKIPKIYFSVV